MNNSRWKKKGIFFTAMLCFFLMAAGCATKEGAQASNGDEKELAAEGGGMTAPVITLGDKFYDVAVKGKNVWAVGYFGTIVQSGDMGKTWTRQTSGTQAALLGVSFVSETVGWAVGDQATILHTVDGGSTWTPQKSPVDAEKLLKVQFVNADEGFAVGSYGVILRTMDGGSTWQRLDFEEDVILNDLAFLDGQNGWVVGEFETILHTRNGGESWQKQRGDQEGKLFGVDFWSPQVGTAVGTSGKILRTTDGGGTWIETGNPTSDTLLKIRYYQSSMAVAVGLRGVVLSSTDNGQTWTPLTLPHHYNWLSGLAFNAEGVGFMVGEQGKILCYSKPDNIWKPAGMTPQHS